MSGTQQQKISAAVERVKSLIYEARDRNEGLRLLACANEIETIIAALRETQLELADYKFIAKHRLEQLTEYWQQEKNSWNGQVDRQAGSFDSHEVDSSRYL